MMVTSWSSYRRSPMGMTSHRDTLLARLDEHQAKALEIIRRGDVSLAPDAVPDPPLLSQSRWELIRIMTTYQAFKHCQLFDPFIRGTDRDKAELATKMKAECIAIGDDFKEHVARCASLDIVAHWESYRSAVAQLLRRIETHMSRERWLIDTKLLAPERPGAVRPGQGTSTVSFASASRSG